MSTCVEPVLLSYSLQEISGRRKAVVRELEAAFTSRWRNVVFEWYLHKDPDFNIDPGLTYNYDL